MPNDDDLDERPYEHDEPPDLIMWSVSVPSIGFGPNGEQITGKLVHTWHFNRPDRVTTHFQPDKEPTNDGQD